MTDMELLKEMKKSEVVGIKAMDHQMGKYEVGKSVIQKVEIERIRAAWLAYSAELTAWINSH